MDQIQSSGLFIPKIHEVSDDVPFLQRQKKRVAQKIIIVHSTKGGVGKTTIVRNLAYSMAYLGKKVVVIDSNTDGNVADAMNVSYAYSFDHWSHFGDMSDETVLQVLAKDEKSGVYLLPSGSNVQIKEFVMKRVLEHVSRLFEVVIVDTETKITISMAEALDVANKIILVGNNNPKIYPRLSYRLLQLRGDVYKDGGLGIPDDKIDFVLNMRKNIDTKITQEILQKRASVVIDFDEKVERVETSNGSAFYDLPKSKFTGTMIDYAKEVLSDVGFTEPKKGRFRKAN